MKHFEEKAYLCALNRIFGFEPKTALALLEHFGSASEVFALNEKELDLILGPYSKHRRSICLRAAEKEARELETLAGKGISFTGWTEKEYPELLRQCEDAPVGLYVRSSTPVEELFKARREIAVVGTRNISFYGKEWCRKTVSAFAGTAEKPRIISGLAFGTDICAHRTALEEGLETIAVMATGPDDIYPRQHRDIAMQISRTPGCALVTDYPPGTAPLAIHFLRRNRIIAGLSGSLLLIESRVKGGGMMTSRLAFSYNRDVYALPGRVDDPVSQGCNYLIKSKIAEPVISLETLMESLGLTSVKSPGNDRWRDGLEREYGERFSRDKVDKMAEMLLAIRKERGIPLDTLCSRCSIGYNEAVTLAGMLEADGFISMDMLHRCTIPSGK